MPQMVLRLFIFLFTASLCLVAASQVEAHPGYYGTAFHAHNLTEAKQLAAREHKLILVYVSEPGGKKMPLFRWRTEANMELAELLIRETVVAEVDAARNAEELSAYELDPPQYLLLDSDGTQFLNFQGDLLTEQITSKLEPFLTGRGAVARARASLRDNGEDHFFSRERLAAALRADGQDAEAVEHYRWCVEQIQNESSRAATSRANYVYKALSEYAEENAEAEALLEESLTEAETEVLQKPNDTGQARRLTGMYLEQQEVSRAKALFDRLSEDSRAKHAMVDLLLDEMLNAGRYEEVLQLIKPAEAMDGEIALYERMKVQRPAWAEKGTGRGTRSFVVKRSLAVIQALAATGQDQKAEDLISRLKEFDDQETTKDRLESTLFEVGSGHLLNTESSDN